MIFSQALKQAGLIPGGIVPASREDPHTNFMGQSWWTDGNRAVFIFDEEVTSLEDLEEFDCDPE